MNRILIAGTGSGCGKTTITRAILKALINRKMIVQPYKCGPDYIDPMFHTYITGRVSRNLDTYMLDEVTIRWLMNKNSQGADISVIEGVMGYYDGIGVDGECSTNTLSDITNTPVILVVNAKGMATSVAAIIKGYIEFKPKNNIKAVILNNINSSYYDIQKKAIEKNTNIKVLGYMPNIKEATLESRHLGLITANEIQKLDSKLQLLAKQAEQTINLDELLKLSQTASILDNSKPDYLDKIVAHNLHNEFKIAIAKDKAFCFYYEDNIDLLKELGAEIIEFSPMNDKKLPSGISGLYIGGGYPEIYLEVLEKNISMKKSVYEAVKNGLPTIAECGGFMYLCNKINTLDGSSYNMVGVLDSEINMNDKLIRFGYVELTTLNENILSQVGWTIKAHEFHYSDSTMNGESFDIKKPSGKSWFGINTTKTLYAGYPHINFWSNINFAVRFCKISNSVNKNSRTLV